MVLKLAACRSLSSGSQTRIESSPASTYSTHFLQFGGKRFHMLGDDVVHRHIAVGQGGGQHIGAGFDLVRDDRIGPAGLEDRYAGDPDDIGAGAADIGAHGVEEVGHIDDMRFTRGILDHGHAFGFGSGDHDVDGRADTDDIQENMLALELGWLPR